MPLLHLSGRRLIMKRSLILVAITIATTLSVGLPSAFATDDTPRLKDILRLENVTIPWLFPLAHPDNGGTCSAIPANVGAINPVDNHSDRVRKITKEVNPDGSQEITQDDLKTGTTVDSNGNTYDFVYKNRVALTVSSGQPANVQVHMTDSFRLKRNGRVMAATFEWRWTYPAPTGVKLTLDPFADFPVEPFVFATADGVNPDTANGVTNWQQLSTQGDPFNCDPL
jgi:hypothetical protein